MKRRTQFFLQADGKVVADEMVTLRKSEVDQLVAEVNALRAWKDSALAVEREWDAQAIATMLGAKPGDSCRKVVAREVPKLVAEIAALRAELEAAKAFHRVAVAERDAARKEAQP